MFTNIQRDFDSLTIVLLIYKILLYVNFTEFYKITCDNHIWVCMDFAVFVKYLFDKNNNPTQIEAKWAQCLYLPFLKKGNLHIWSQFFFLAAFNFFCC